MKKAVVKPDCVYVNGCSWTHGSELLDPASTVEDHFDPVHDQYRRRHFWPQLIANRFNAGEVVDGSTPGGSNDRILRTTIRDVMHLVSQGRRPFVVIAWSQLHRFELCDGNNDGLWRCFVNPNDTNNPAVATETWGSWSSDRTDVERWLTCMISLDTFLKTVAVPYISTTAFSQTYRLYERHTGDLYFEPYLNYLKTQLELPRHMLHTSLETHLRQFPNVRYGRGGHPLERGHELIADYIWTNIMNQYLFQRPELTKSNI